MRLALATVLLLLSVAVAWGEPPAAPVARPPAATLEKTLALFQQIDPAALPPAQRQTLYLAVVDALLGDGQQGRALEFLAGLRTGTPAPPQDPGDEQVTLRLRRIDTPLLVAALQAATPLAALIRTELAARGAPLPDKPLKEVQIGVLLPLSGRYAAFGKELQQGVELARTTLSPSLPIRFVYADTGADGVVAAELTAGLAARPEVLAIVGPLLNGEAASVAERAGRERLPLLLLAPREGVPGGYVFRVALTAAAQVNELAGFADRERQQRVALLHPANRQGELNAGLFAAAIVARGGQVVARQSYPPDSVDLRQQLQALAQEARRQGGQPPDALFLPDDARQVAQIIPQLGFVRFDLLQLLGTSAWNDPDLVRLAGPQVEGAVFVDGFFAGSQRPEVRDFVTRFQSAYGTPPGLLAAYGYDAATLLLTVLSSPESYDREAVRQALSALRDFPGVTGLTGFTPEGEARRRPFLLQVQDGAVVQIN